MSKIKVKSVHIDGKRIFSLFGLNWKYDKKNRNIIFRKPSGEGNKITIKWVDDKVKSRKEIKTWDYLEIFYRCRLRSHRYHSGWLMLLFRTNPTESVRKIDE